MGKRAHEAEQRLAESESKNKKLIEEHAQIISGLRKENADKLKALEESVQSYQARYLRTVFHPSLNILLIE